jgi:hypothetical protein
VKPALLVLAHELFDRALAHIGRLVVDQRIFRVWASEGCVRLAAVVFRLRIRVELVSGGGASVWPDLRAIGIVASHAAECEHSRGDDDQ